ncbi:MAG: flavodoxin family protein [Methanomassiliicoccales archaeon]|nr:flavodoxin family protein [Methanomassiliicoccales archaeon]
MRIVALNGSPRPEGNTAQVLREMTKEHADVDLDYYDLGRLNIKDCQGCYHCKRHENCVIQDDMQMLYRKIKEAQALVLGSPIYFGAETAPTKAFLDRMYAFLAPSEGPRKYVSRLKEKKKAIIVLTCGNVKGNEVYAHLKDRMYSAYGNLGFSDVHPYIIGGTSPAVNILELTDAQDMLRECREVLEE